MTLPQSTSVEQHDLVDDALHSDTQRRAAEHVERQVSPDVHPGGRHDRDR
jgi:hypothetical protein